MIVFFSLLILYYFEAKFLFKHSDPENILKVGEGTYGEAFKVGETVCKIVPFDGDIRVNGELQKVINLIVFHLRTCASEIFTFEDIDVKFWFFLSSKDLVLQYLKSSLVENLDFFPRNMHHKFITSQGSKMRVYAMF